MWAPSRLFLFFVLANCRTPADASPPQVDRAAGFSGETLNIWRWIRYGRSVNNYPTSFKQFLWTSDAMWEATSALKDFEESTNESAQEARDLFFYSILGASRTDTENIFELNDAASRYVARRLVNRYHSSLDL